MKKTLYALTCALCALLVLPAAAQVPDYVPTEGLIAWYPFQGNTNDESGNGYNFLTQNVVSAMDRFGNDNNALYFNQTAFGLNTAYNIGNNPGFTASTWFKVSSGSEGGHLWHIQSNQRSFSLFNSSAGIIFRVWNYDLLFDLATNIFSLDEWHNVTVTSNFIDDTRIYLDGELRSQIGIPVPVPNNVSLFYLGRNAGWDPPMGAFMGNLDDIAIYNRALSETEINEIYTGVAISDSPLFQVGAGVTDVDGNTYSTVLINNQEWMSENLNVASFCNGDPITNANYWPEWVDIVEPRRCAYDANEAYRDQFGSLYNFWAVRDDRNICPCGWHVPSLSEYQSLETYLGGNEVAGGKIKGVETWVGNNLGDLNASGLNMLAGGNVADNFYSSMMGEGATIWLNTMVDGFWAYFADFRADRTWAYIDDVYPMEGFYVRCVRDSDNSQVVGCTDFAACNYSDSASVDDGSCLYNGSICDDGNSMTQNDTINELCECNGSSLLATCVSLPSNLQQGLVGYWPFCGNANDESGNGNDGVVNGATLTEDRFGNSNSAYAFTGGPNADADDIGLNNPIISDSDFSICYWMNTDYFSDSRHITFIGNDGDGFEFMAHGDSSIFFRNWNSLNSVPTLDLFFETGFNLRDTNNYCLTYDHQQVNFFVNGTAVSSVSFNTLDTPFGGFIKLGRHPFYENNALTALAGTLDDIGIWNRALTPEEVQELYTLDACTFTVYDTVIVENVIDVFDTTTVVETVVVFDTLTVENVIDVFDTITVVENVVVFDTLTVENVIDVYDTTYVTVTDTLIIDIPSGVGGTILNTLLLYPNPTSEQLTINYGNFAAMAGYSLSIFDNGGSTVHETNITQAQETLDISQWSAGVYQVVVYNASGIPVETRQIVRL